MEEKLPEQKEVVIVDKHGKHHRGAAVLLDTDDLVREQVGGFKNFLQDFAVVGLAIGFIIGSQGSAVMKSFVDAFLNPLAEFIFGTNLSGRFAIVHHHEQAVKIPWGGFVYALVELFFVLITLYIIIMLFHLDRYTGKTKNKK